jgi:tripartite-type tricarboxylate transporter receptor subunit TctC
MTRFLSAVAVLLALISNALAQPYPTKPVRMIVAFAPGGPADIAARLVGAKLPDILGQQLLVDNRAGAGGNIGAAAVAKSAPDGYTALVTTSAIAVNMTLFASPGYDAERDFVPVIQLATQPNMVFVNAALPAKTLDELLKSAQAHFKGAGPMVAAVVGGEPPVGCGAISGPLAQIKGGKLRGLAVSSSRRLASLPDVPTLGELGFQGMEDYTWIGMFLPAGTPSDVVQRLNEALNRALQAPDTRERLDALAFEPVGGSQREFADYVKAEIAKWAKVVRETGAKSG